MKVSEPGDDAFPQDGCWMGCLGLDPDSEGEHAVQPMHLSDAAMGVCTYISVEVWTRRSDRYVHASVLKCGRAGVTGMYVHQC